MIEYNWHWRDSYDSKLGCLDDRNMDRASTIPSAIGVDDWALDTDCDSRTNWFCEPQKELK